MPKTKETVVRGDSIEIFLKRNIRSNMIAGNKKLISPTDYVQNSNILESNSNQLRNIGPGENELDMLNILEKKRRRGELEAHVTGPCENNSQMTRKREREHKHRSYTF